jgi:Lon protease-like protein
MMSDDGSIPADFSGIARLFPLPNLVLFPAVIQGLHIFEPRYRQMTADALASDQLIAMALLRPGWDADYAGRPAIHPVACLGKVIVHDQLEDGRYNLQLRGLGRVRMIEEIDSPKLYRSAHVEPLVDQPIHNPLIAQELRNRLAHRVEAKLQGQAAGAEMFMRLLKSDLELGLLCDLLGYALPLSLERKQEMLACTDVESRLRLLLRDLDGEDAASEAASKKPPFPPEFSSN